MNVVGDEDGGWAGLAGCPYGVQGNNRGGKDGEGALITEAGTVLSDLCVVQPQLQLSLGFLKHAYAGTGSGD